MTKSKQSFLGIVVRPKLRTTTTIEILPIEVIHQINGAVSSPENINVSGLLGNEQIDLKLSKYNTIRASWRPNADTNRTTAPDVQTGEVVRIYTYKNTGTYYWHTQGHDNNVRKKETVMYLFGNESTIGAPLDITNSHWLLVSSHDQYIRLHTSDNDSEVCTYDIVLNMRDGFLSVKDGLDNEVLLDSANGVLKAAINEEVLVDTNKVTINNKTTTINTSGDVTVNATNATVNVDNAVNLSGKTLSASFNTISLNGNTTITGPCMVNGSIGATGDFTASGDGVFSSVFAPQITGNMCNCPNLKSK